MSAERKPGKAPRRMGQMKILVYDDMSVAQHEVNALLQAGWIPHDSEIVQTGGGKVRYEFILFEPYDENAALQAEARADPKPRG